MDKLYKKKYLKYKNKYLTLQNQSGGNKELIIQNAEIIIKDIDKYSIKNIDKQTIQINVLNSLQKIINTINNNSNLELSTIIKFKDDINTLLKLYDKHYEDLRSNIIKNSKSLILNSSSLISAPKVIEFRFIGAGGFGCVFSPPKLITPLVQQEYPKGGKININQYNDDYVAKILSCEKNVYKKEVNSNMLIKEFDKGGNYTPEMIFAGYMERKVLMDYIKKQRGKNTNTELYNCLYDKLNNNMHQYYGYIISTKVGKSCDNLTIDDINKSNIKDVLTSFSKGIKIFINNLYDKEYLHGDIKIPNMTMKDNKIYFIDFGFTDIYTNILKNYPIVLSRSLNFNYPIILHLFSILYYNNNNLLITKEEYKFLLNKIITNLELPEYEQLYNVINTLIVSHQDSIFKNIQDVKTYLKTYIEQLLDKLDNNKKYSKKNVYDICFLQIARNVDIYSLSLVMFHMFYNNIYQDNFTLTYLLSSDTLKLISKLFKDALYNNIKNPLDLANRLDNIINTIN